MSSEEDNISNEDVEDCNCITCQAEQIGMKRNDVGYEGELRKLILIGRNKEPFPDWDMVSGFFEDWCNPFFRGPNLYNCYRLMENNYNRHQWLTGCPGFTNFFCFPCTLFARGEAGTNFLIGDIDLVNITSHAEKHSKNARHLKHVQKWLSYEQPTNFRYLDYREKTRIFCHDEVIRKRRTLVCFMMTAVVLLATQGLWFRKKPHREKEYDDKFQFKNDDKPDPGPLMEGMFFETIKFLVQYTENNDITNQLIFQEWTTLDVQTKLISAIADTIRLNVKSELDTAEFVSIIVDKPLPILDIDCPRTCTILRYIDGKGGIHETCLGLYVLEPSYISLLSHVRQIVESYSLKNKLVAVACDGGSLISTQLPDFQQKMRELYPKAVFVHCYAHVTDCVILQSLGSEVDSASSFVRLFAMIVDLFRGNVERQNDLGKFISLRSRIQQPLNFDGKLVQTLNQYRNQLIDYFITLPNETSLYNVERGDGILDDVCKLIKEVKSAFGMKLFSKIFLLLEPLSKAINSDGLNVTSCAKQVGEFLDEMKALKDQGFETMWAFVKSAYINVKTPAEFGETSSQDLMSNYKNYFNDILDNVINHFTARFNYFTFLDFLPLLDPKRFPSYLKHFPEDTLKSLFKQYHHTFQPQLKEELKILYNNQKLHNKNMVVFLEQFNDLKCGPLPEIRKLVHLALTLPLCPISSEISKYRKVENYIRLAKGVDLKESLQDLSMICLEKSYIGELDSKTVESRRTIDKIIDLFAEKTNEEKYAYINP